MQVFFETPTNPFLATVPIGAVASAAKANNPGALVVVDNTWATPLFQKPLEHGADVSLYSATKYFSGHSDVMGGVVVVQDEELEARLREERFYTGAILEPHSAWLLRRSMQTYVGPGCAPGLCVRWQEGACRAVWMVLHTPVTFTVTCAGTHTQLPVAHEGPRRDHPENGRGGSTPISRRASVLPGSGRHPTDGVRCRTVPPPPTIPPPTRTGVRGRCVPQPCCRLSAS